MTWLFSKALMDSVSLPSSPEPEAESWPGTFSDGEPSAQWNVMPTPQGFWRNDKMMNAFRLSRFGPTLRLLTEQHGEAVLTSFLEDFPVRTYPLQAAERESLESAQVCGRSSLESLAKYDHEESTWKTPQLSLLGDSELFLETWPRSGSMRNGECWAQPMLAATMKGFESGYWPTVTARDYKSDSCSAEVKAIRDAHSRGKTLPWVLGGLLNPTWAEWLMGWPEGWTEFVPLETGKFQEWQLQHSLNWQEGSGAA
jgi:hypothetical protein